MPRYRVHILDRRGELIGVVDLDCFDEQTETIDGYHAAEVWRGRRGKQFSQALTSPPDEISRAWVRWPLASARSRRLSPSSD